MNSVRNATNLSAFATFPADSTATIVIGTAAAVFGGTISTATSAISATSISTTTITALAILRASRSRIAVRGSPEATWIPIIARPLAVQVRVRASDAFPCLIVAKHSSSATWRSTRFADMPIAHFGSVAIQAVVTTNRGRATREARLNRVAISDNLRNGVRIVKRVGAGDEGVHSIGRATTVVGVPVMA